MVLVISLKNKSKITSPIDSDLFLFIFFFLCQETSVFLRMPVLYVRPMAFRLDFCGPTWPESD